MSDMSLKSIKTFERGVEPMPKLAADLKLPVEPVLVDRQPSDVRTVWVAKLDAKTVWRVIDMLKSL
jgi:hypothetical protein